MKQNTKFGRMVEESLQNQTSSSAPKISKKVQKEAKKLMERRLEQLKRSGLSTKEAKRIVEEEENGYQSAMVNQTAEAPVILEENTVAEPVNSDLQQTDVETVENYGDVSSERSDMHEEEQKVETEPSQPTEQDSVADNKVQKIDLSELAKVQAELRREQGIPDTPEIVIEKYDKKDDEEQKVEESDGARSEEADEYESLTDEEKDKYAFKKLLEINDQSKIIDIEPKAEESQALTKKEDDKNTNIENDQQLNGETSEAETREESEAYQSEQNVSNDAELSDVQEDTISDNSEDVFGDVKPIDTSEDNAQDVDQAVETDNEENSINEPEPKEQEEDAENKKVSKISREELEALKNDKIANYTPKEVKETDKIHKISMSELEEVKAELRRERGEEDPTPKKNAKAVDESGDTIEEAPNRKKKGLFSKGEDTISAPDVSEEDELSDEEIFDSLNQKDIVIGEEENYDGMSEQEIAEAKARKKRFNQLKKKYNDREVKDPEDVGDYKKHLDFSVNKDIKHFRVKPPKKPFIISSIILAVLLALGGLLTYLILNKPAPPVTLVAVKLSQNQTYQFVGDEVDLRGLYIEMKYSNGKVTKQPVNAEMITSTSSNISDELIINNVSSSTYVQFAYKDFSNDDTRLNIILTPLRVSEITSVEFYGDAYKDAEFKFSDILVLVKVVDKNSGEYIGTKRVAPESAEYSLESQGIVFDKTSTGINFSKAERGTYVLTITLNIDGVRLVYKIDGFKIN